MFVVCAFILVGFMGSVSFAADSQPKDGNGVVVLPEYAGCSAAVVTSSTTATVVASGAYYLCGVSVSSATTSDYVVVADSASATGITSSYATRILVPWLFSNANATPIAKYDFPSFVPVTTYGITVINSAANMKTVIYYRKK